jgi:hypothetical protein
VPRNILDTGTGASDSGDEEANFGASGKDAYIASQAPIMSHLITDPFKNQSISMQLQKEDFITGMAAALANLISLLLF